MNAMVRRVVRTSTVLVFALLIGFLTGLLPRIGGFGWAMLVGCFLCMWLGRNRLRHLLNGYILG